MRTFTVALLRSAVGMIAMTEPGIFQSGYAFSMASTGCSATHAVDERLVHVHLDLERVHVHDGADAGAREAAAGRDGRDHLAGLRGLGDHHAAERAPGSPCCRARPGPPSPPPSATRTCSPFAASRARSMSRCARAASIACAATSCRLVAAPAPRVVALGLLELRADLALLRARGGELRPREPELRLGLRVVEPGEDLALLDAHALLDAAPR